MIERKKESSNKERVRDIVRERERESLLVSERDTANSLKRKSLLLGEVDE